MVYMLTLGGILMGSMLPYIAYMDPMGMNVSSGHVPPNGNHVTCGLRGPLYKV